MTAGGSGDSVRSVCHLVDVSHDAPYFRSLARGHRGSRFRVVIGSVGPAGPLQDAMARLDTPTFALGATGRRGYLVALVRLRNILRRHQICVLHAHGFDPTVLGLAGAWLAGSRFVYTRHHSDQHQRMLKRWHTRVDAVCGRWANHAIAVSEATRRVMVELEGVPAGNVTVVYNGMEWIPDPPPDRVAQARRDLGLGDGPVCLMVGRLHEEKGHQILFEALPSVMERVGRLQVLLAGEGPARAALEAEVEARGLRGTARFLGQRTDVAVLMALADVVVQPSLGESFGLAVVEAMQRGRPVVASSVGGLAEIIASGKNGLLVPSSNAGELADALARVLTDRELADRLGLAARIRAADFTFERMLDGYFRVYDLVLD